MSINLMDIVKPQVGVKAKNQAAGTPNETGICGVFPFVVGKNSVFFADVFANTNYADVNNLTIANTTIAGITISNFQHLQTER